MTTKERHVLRFWYDGAAICIKNANRIVSAGEVGRHVGQTTSTAKKYLNRLVKEGALISYRVEFKNGIVGTQYGLVE